MDVHKVLFNPYSADNTEIFFLENRIWHFMQIVSILGKIRKIFLCVVCWKFTQTRELNLSKKSWSSFSDHLDITLTLTVLTGP